ncbi:MAG: triose-phosphate isomerase [Candidatus Sumerlaeia bacterium]|nr:triose-phosphate isomerase [Candidatus Sumerlaeia bacterium]
MSRKPFVAGNWKLNGTLSEAADLLGALLPMIQSVHDVDVAVCPPFTSLAGVRDRIAGSRVMLGAQNLYAAEKDGKLIHAGAYTGEISAPMLKEAGVRWVILGHSERRQYFGETDSGVNRKARACYEVGLLPIICVGETLEEREGARTAAVIDTQVRGCLANLPMDRMAESVIAYEPVWAIGTGKTATAEQAQEVHAQIRGLLATLFSARVADAVRIQYGGSVKPGNAKEIFGKPDVDGGLIGGAALKAEDFAAIVHAAR